MRSPDSHQLCTARIIPSHVRSILADWGRLLDAGGWLSIPLFAFLFWP